MSVCLCVCLSVCLSVCGLLRYRLNVFLHPLPKVGGALFLGIWKPWGKVMETSGLLSRPKGSLVPCAETFRDKLLLDGSQSREHKGPPPSFNTKAESMHLAHISLLNIPWVGLACHDMGSLLYSSRGHANSHMYIYIKIYMYVMEAFKKNHWIFDRGQTPWAADDDLNNAISDLTPSGLSWYGGLCSVLGLGFWDYTDRGET